MTRGRRARPSVAPGVRSEVTARAGVTPAVLLPDPADMTDTEIVTLIVALAGGGGLGGLVTNWWKGRAEQTTAESTKAAVDNDRANRLDGFAMGILTELKGEVSELKADVARSTDRWLACEAERAVMSTELSSAQSRLDSQQHQIESLVRRSNATAVAGFEVITSDDGLIADVTDSVLPMLGWRAGELIGQHISQVVLDPELHAQLLERVAHDVNPMGGVAIEAAALHRDGTMLRVDVLLRHRRDTEPGYLARIIDGDWTL